MGSGSGGEYEYALHWYFILVVFGSRRRRRTVVGSLHIQFLLYTLHCDTPLPLCSILFVFFMFQ